MIYSVTGAINGVNTTFTSTTAYAAGTAHLVLNGRIVPTNDATYGLTETSSTQFTLATAPATDDVVELLAEPFTPTTVAATDPGYRGVQEVMYGATGQVITCWPDLNGVQINPAAGSTVEIYRPGQDDTSPYITSTAATEDGTTHQLSYTLDASDKTVWFLGEDYRARFTWSDGARTRTTVVTFEVVRQPLNYNCPITYEDLVKSFAAVTEAMEQAGETAATIGSNIVMQAWADVLAWVRSKGKRPALTTGKEDLERVTLYRAQQLMFGYLSEAPGDIWATREEKAAENYKQAQAECVLKYREADSTTPMTERGFQQPMLSAGNDLGVGGFYPLRGRGVRVGGWKPGGMP